MRRWRRGGDYRKDFESRHFAKIANEPMAQPQVARTDAPRKVSEELVRHVAVRDPYPELDLGTFWTVRERYDLPSADRFCVENELM